MMVVELSTTPEVALSPARLLFDESYAFGSGITIANYDVTRDGRLVMVRDESTAARLHVVVNWFAHLDRPAPAAAQ